MDFLACIERKLELADSDFLERALASAGSFLKGSAADADQLTGLLGALRSLSDEIRLKCTSHFDAQLMASILAQDRHEHAIKRFCDDDLAGQALIDFAKALDGGLSLPPADALAIVVPGNAASQLGTKLDGPVWMDSFAFPTSWDALRLDGSTVQAQGLLPSEQVTFAYLAFLLRWNGFDVWFYPYDWRRGFDESGGGLAEFMTNLQLERNLPAYVLTHNMGGPVARAALSELKRRREMGEPAAVVDQFMMLAPPNRGFCGAVEAFLGDEVLIANMCDLSPIMLDLLNWGSSLTNVRLTRAVTDTWAGWYQLLPFYDENHVYLYNAGNWPEPRPSPELLERAVRAQRGLALPPAPEDPEYDSWHLVMGSGLRTVCIERGFVLGSTDLGDSQILVDRGRLEHLSPKIFDGVDHRGLRVFPEVIHYVVSVLAKNFEPAPAW